MVIFFERNILQEKRLIYQCLNTRHDLEENVKSQISAFLKGQTYVLKHQAWNDLSLCV